MPANWASKPLALPGFLAILALGGCVQPSSDHDQQEGMRLVDLLVCPIGNCTNDATQLEVHAQPSFGGICLDSTLPGETQAAIYKTANGIGVSISTSDPNRLEAVARFTADSSAGFVWEFHRNAWVEIANAPTSGQIEILLHTLTVKSDVA